MNIEDFVTYEQALALKKLGFKEECFYHYDHNNHDDIVPNSDTSHLSTSINDFKISFNELEFYDEICYDAPTLEQVKKWLRINHKIFITTDTYFRNYIEGNYSNPEYEYVLVDMRKDNRANRTNSSYDKILFNTPEEALSAGITECLKILEIK